MTKTTKSLLPFFLLLLVAMLTLGIGTALAATGDPEIAISSEIPAAPNSDVEIPVKLTSNGNNVSSMAFSLDYDQTWLSFDASLPYSITFNLPVGIVGSCTVDTADTNGEIDCIVVDPMAPLASVPDGSFLTIKLVTLDAPDNTIAAVNFAQVPPPSFGDTSGQGGSFTVEHGSVKIDSGLKSGKIFLPMVVKQPTPTPSPTPEFTYTPTSTLPPGETPTKTPTPKEPTATPTPTGTIECSDYIVNGSFEDTSDKENDNEGWEIPVTSYSASFSTKKAHSGDRALLTGIIDPNQNTYSWSSGYQIIALPGDADSVKLTFWSFPQSGDALVQRLASSLWGRISGVSAFAPEAFDMQYVAVEDLSLGTDAEIVYWQVSDSRKWDEVTINLKDYAGHVIKIWFTTYNDGNDGVTAMYIDDVSLEVCK